MSRTRVTISKHFAQRLFPFDKMIDGETAISFSPYIFVYPTGDKVNRIIEITFMQTIAVFPLLNCSGAYMIFSILGLAVV